MNFDFSVSYMDCQKCGERVNCDKCENKLTDKLLGMAEFDQVELNIANKRITGVAAVEDEDDILDALEEVGLFS